MPTPEPADGAVPETAKPSRPWRVDGAAIIGARKAQEDSYALGDDQAAPGQLLIVADGMGGHAAGEHASRTAVDGFAAAFARSRGTVAQRLEAALYESNHRIGEAAARDPSRAGMGCTLVAAHIGPAGLHWVSVGDSLLWLWRGGRLRRLNEDHSMRSVIEHEVATGRLSAAAAASDPRRNSLLSALTGEDVPRIDLPTTATPLQPGDVVVLASDGLLTLDEAEIARTIGEAAALRTLDDGVRPLAGELLARVERAAVPRQDNCTVVIAAWPGETPSRLAAALGWARDRLHLAMRMIGLHR